MQNVTLLKEKILNQNYYDDHCTAILKAICIAEINFPI